MTGDGKTGGNLHSSRVCIYYLIVAEIKANSQFTNELCLKMVTHTYVCAEKLTSSRPSVA